MMEINDIGVRLRDALAVANWSDQMRFAEMGQVNSGWRLYPEDVLFSFPPARHHRSHPALISWCTLAVIAIATGVVLNFL
jgi:hypothetical protein